MYPTVTIENVIDEFKKEIYRFSIMKFDVVLDEYSIQTRETKRHKFKRVKWYDRLRPRDSNLKYEDISVDEPLIQRVKIEYFSMLKFKK